MSANDPLLVTIDGPAASGKTSVALEIAKRFDLYFLPGGIFLRSFAYYVIRQGCNPQDQQEVNILIDSFCIETFGDAKKNDYVVIVNGEQVQASLWSPEVDMIVSDTSRLPRVRAARVEWERSLANGKRLVADGRTLGSEVFPWADIKIYLTASIERRAQRRVAQYSFSGGPVLTIDDVRRQIEQRDQADAVGYLDRTKKYPDQHVIDSTDMDILGVVDRVSSIIQLKGFAADLTWFQDDN